MARRIKLSQPQATNREFARTCLAALNSPEIVGDAADLDLVVIGLAGVGYAMLDVADAFRERNYLLTEMAKRDSET